MGLCERLVNELRNPEGLLGHLTVRPSIGFAGANVSLGEAELSPKRMPETLRRTRTNALTDVPIDEVRTAFAETFADSGMTIDERQLRTAAEATAGYPYMIQLVGYHIWDMADMRDSSTITDADVEHGIAEAHADLDNAVCIPELHGLSQNDRAYLKAMAESDGPSSTADVAKRMGRTANYAATYRKRLLDAYVIRETERGEVDFAVPFLREYLRRTN